MTRRLEIEMPRNYTVICNDFEFSFNGKKRSKNGPYQGLANVKIDFTTRGTPTLHMPAHALHMCKHASLSVDTTRRCRREEKPHPNNFWERDGSGLPYRPQLSTIHSQSPTTSPFSPYSACARIEPCFHQNSRTSA